MLSIDDRLMFDTPSMFKKHLVLSIIATCNCIFTFQVRHADIKIPDFLIKENQSLGSFEIGLNMKIPDLRINDSGISGTLSFNKKDHHCFISWDAITSIRAKDSQLIKNVDLTLVVKEKNKDFFQSKSKISPSKNKFAKRSGKKIELPPYLRVIK